MIAVAVVDLDIVGEYPLKWHHALKFRLEEFIDQGMLIVIGKIVVDYFFTGL